ncbi:G-protein coupled receptor Git3 [Schizosaccharomyces japonicus yFS275]|uniref:G-protein coupled receptor Git3 n=1 Tax=Schizosaccharomyces japonicus (strain yFS275 / FY16936) TaxID=402676 RepID=B6JYN3_SCHJY|nr:G-protein coupled receptor Git3 [Schizosaccharomyces japonicus yFS275]EEB06651.1 G-protein coupled receptor Git3 [Schizosaccharomyces japonicus yFS275]
MSYDPTYTGDILVLSLRELKNLRIMVIVASSVSVLFSFGTVVYRVRQRERYFRDHILIALFTTLFFRSIVQIIHPSITINHLLYFVPKWRCFTIGFFLFVFVRMTDYWIFIVVLHNALVVLSKKNITSNNIGLYPYRWWVFALSFILPFGLGGLTFVNRTNTYVNLQTRCFLPLRPVRWMFGFNWSIDYCLSLFILIIHTCMFLSIRKSIRRFKRDTNQHITALEQFDRSLEDQLQNNESSSPSGNTGSSATYQGVSSSSSVSMAAIEADISVNPSAGYTNPELLGDYYHHDPLYQHRRDILRQSKFLFAYPVVFSIMWLLPQLQMIAVLTRRNQCVGACKNFAFVAVFSDNCVTLFLLLCDFIWFVWSKTQHIIDKRRQRRHSINSERN